MSSLSKFETNNSLQGLLDNEFLENKKIKKIRKTLLNLEKEEASLFSPIKVKVYKEKKKDYLEDFKRYKGFINAESGLITSSNEAKSVQIEQNESSDLVESE